MNPYSPSGTKGTEDQETINFSHSNKRYYMLFSLLWMLFIGGYIWIGIHSGKFQDQQRLLAWHVLGAGFLLSIYVGWMGQHLLQTIYRKGYKKFIMSSLVQILLIGIIWPTIYWLAVFSFIFQLKGEIKVPMESSFFLWVLASYPHFFIRIVLPFFLVTLIIMFVFKNTIRRSQCA